MPKLLINSSAAFLSGLLMGCATAPISAWGLAWVALAPLWMITVKTRSTKPAIAWGIAYYGFALHWITGLHPLMWLGIPWLGSVAIVAFAWTFITVWGAIGVALWAWVIAWMSRHNFTAWRRILVGVTLWCAVETIRQWSPLDWTPLAFTQSPHDLPILYLGQLSGANTVTAAIVLVNGLLAEAGLATGAQRLKWGAGAIASFLTLHLLGLGVSLLAVDNAPSQALKVGFVQGNVPTREKLFQNGLQLALDNYSTGYRSLSDQSVNLVVMPEGALPFLWQGDRTQNAVSQAILNKRIPALLGTFVPQGNGYTQSLLAIDGSGATVGRYNKIKLVPLGEYMPFEGILGRLSPIKSSLLPGAMHQQVETPVGRIGVGICFDSAFPAVFRNQIAQGGQFIVTASNLDPYSTVLMAQAEAHDVMRSIETDRWTVRATNTGYSGMVDPGGRIVWRSQPNQFEVHAETIYRRQTQTLYVRWGNWLTPTLLIMSVILLKHRDSHSLR